MKTFLQELTEQVIPDYKMEEQLNETAEVLIVTEVLLEALYMPDETKKISYEKLLDLYDETLKRFAAARKGLSLVSKLKPGPDRVKHAGLIFSHMNKIRGLQKRLEKKIMGTMDEGLIRSDVDIRQLYTEAKAEMNQLDSLAQKVWAAESNETKIKAMHKLIDNFKFKEQQEKHRAKLEGMSNARLDKFAADLMLVGHGDKRIK